ncbi:MAG TPA: hypothetical protein VH762_14160 [Gemmatimonadaceae bacterium]|jgi:hypothetical protein
MERQTLVNLMVALLQPLLDDQNEGQNVKATQTLSLVGDGAALTSMRLVSFIADLETTLATDHGLSVTLVSERALSRQKSPFRNIDALADFVLELIATEKGAPAA